MLSELAAEYSRYKALVDRSRYRDRIEFLIQHPELAAATLNEERKIQPSCYGTAAFVIDKQRTVKELWKNAGHPLDYYANGYGDFVCIPDETKPGYLGEKPMTLLQASLNESMVTPDTLISFSWNIPNTELCGMRLRHAGIYLGQLSNQNIFFQQLGEGERFGFSSLQQFEEALSTQERKTLDIRLYQP